MDPTLRLRQAACAACIVLLAFVALAPAGSAQAAPAFVFTHSGSSTSVPESGGADTYKVRLSSPPAGPSLTVTLTTSLGQVRFQPDASSAPVASTTLVFTPADYSTDRTVRVVATDDPAVEGTVRDTIQHVPDAGDAVYGSVRGSLTVTVVDDDLGLGIGQTDGATQVKEDPTASGRTDTFTLSLGRKPAADVHVRILPDAQLSTSLLSATFTPTNWASLKSFTVAAVPDDVAEDTLVRPVSFALTSADPAYDGRTANLAVTILDEDVAGLRFVESGATLTGDAPKLAAVVSEAGAKATYQVALTSRPTAGVTVTPSGLPAGQLSFAPASLAFTAANWATPQTLTVSAVDDRVDEGDDAAPAAVSIQHGVSSADPFYGSSAARALAVDVRDNDVAGVRLTQGTTTLAATTPPAAPPKLAGTALEGGAPLEYFVVLDSQPTAPVAFALSFDRATPATLGPTTFSFTASDWNVPKRVSIAVAADSFDEGPAVQTLTITHGTTTADAIYDALADRQVRADVGDDDVAKVLLVAGETPASVSEAGDALTYTLRLQTAPTGTVTVTPAPADSAALSVSPGSVVFTPGDWSVPQSVTVRTADDAVPEFDAVVSLDHTVASSDPDYDATAKPPALSVHVLDNDGVLVLVPSGGTTQPTEGGSDTYTVRLIGNPTSAVQVTVTASSPAFTVDGGASTVLTFLPANAGGLPAPCPADPKKACQWDNPQTVTVHGPDNSRVDGTRTGTIAHVTSVASGGDARFQGKASPALPVSVLDDDAPGLVLDGGAANQMPPLSLAEGASRIMTARLSSQPSANVLVTFAPSAGVSVSPASWTFTPSNWAHEARLTVASAQDRVDRGTTFVASLAITTASSDALYSGSPGPLVVTVTDDDTAGFVFDEDVARLGQLPSLAMAEGATDTYTVRLNSQPTGDVTLALSAQGLVSVSPSSVVFGAATWETPRTITVTALPDSVDRGTSYSAGVAQATTTADALYQAVPGPVPATVTDDDIAGVLLSASGPTTVAEAGASTTVGVALTSQPLAPVTVALSGGGGEVAFSPASLTFGPSDWNTAKAVQVSAVDDSQPEFHEDVALSATASSGDATYHARTAALALKVLDDDGVLVVTETGGGTVTREGSYADTYTVRLIAEPTGPVTVTVSVSDTKLFRVNGASSATLTFEPGGLDGVDAPCQGDPARPACRWDAPQTVTVRAVNDIVGEPAMSGSISHLASSLDDARYHGRTGTPVAVTVLDNDAGFLFEQSGGSTAVVEGGAADSYTIALTTPPTFSVTLTLAAGDGLTVSPTTLRFDAQTWNVPQTVTVQASDDGVAQGTRTVAVTTQAASADERYNGFAVPVLPVAVSDDE